MSPRETHELGFLHCRCESLDHIVARVDFQQQAGSRTKRLFVVGEVCPVGGSHLDQPGAGPRHDGRHAKGAADLHELAPGDGDLASQCQAVEKQHDGGCIVIHDKRTFGARQALKTESDIGRTASTSAACEIIFQRRGTRSDPHHGLDGRGRQRCASEIGMKNRAGEIEDPTWARLHACPAEGLDEGRTSAGRPVDAGMVANDVAHTFLNQAPPEEILNAGHGRHSQNRVHARRASGGVHHRRSPPEAERRHANWFGPMMQGTVAAMTEHRLRPLLEPRSIALVGASARPDSFGYATLRNLASPHYRGRIHAVNPRYDRIDDIDCHPSLGDVPGGVEHAILSVANARIEAALVDAVEAGVRSVTIFGSAYLDGDTDRSNLKDRLQGIAREAGLLVIGANCMGFVNYTAGARVTWMNVPEDGWFDPGHITLISHSGTCFLTLQFVDPRHRHNLCVSAGQELTVTAADYIDYALDKESTRVIALFLETVRDPDAFRAALDRAARADVPVVAIKVGRTGRSAELARSHSGALAGNDAAHEAVFDHYGVLRVDTWNELAAASRLFAHHKEIAPGGLSGIMDSGGARGMLLDLAARMDVPFADIGDGTVKTLSGLLEYGLEPVNPTDVWGSGRDWQDVYTGSMKALADDPTSAMTGIFADLGDSDTGGAVYLELCEKIEQETEKPVFFCQHWSRAMDPEMTRRTAESPVLVIDGTETFLTAVHLAMQRRDRVDDSPGDMAPVPAEPVIERWRQRLARTEALDEHEGLTLLESFGMAAPARRMAASADECAAAADAIGWPVALKTAARGLAHKSDVSGVILAIADEKELLRAWHDISGRLGPRVLVEAMAPRGVEMAAGIVIDRQFGPLVMIAAGGVLIETHADRRFILPPAGRASARRAIDQLACRPLLDGVRGNEAVDVEALVDVVARLSVIATTLGDHIAEFDINPLIVHPQGCQAVDALVIQCAHP